MLEQIPLGTWDHLSSWCWNKFLWEHEIITRVDVGTNSFGDMRSSLVLMLEQIPLGTWDHLSCWCWNKFLWEHEIISRSCSSVFDGVGLAGFKSRARLLCWPKLLYPYYIVFYSLSLYLNQFNQQENIIFSSAIYSTLLTFVGIKDCMLADLL